MPAPQYQMVGLEFRPFFANLRTEIAGNSIRVNEPSPTIPLASKCGTRSVNIRESYRAARKNHWTTKRTSGKLRKGWARWEPNCGGLGRDSDHLRWSVGCRFNGTSRCRWPTRLCDGSLCRVLREGAPVYQGAMEAAKRAIKFQRGQLKAIEAPGKTGAFFASSITTSMRVAQSRPAVVRDFR